MTKIDVLSNIYRFGRGVVIRKTKVCFSNGEKNIKLTVSIVKCLNLETTSMKYTKHLNGRRGKRIKVEKWKKEHR